MAPIRIAFIGLSANGGWATSAHLPYLQQTDKFQVVGICNSSKESGDAAIKKYRLPEGTKSYASPEELADDADSFDLAVCSVWVNKHYDAIKPVAAKGKPCYVEWPLCRTLQEAQDLHSIASKAGNTHSNIVGLQARFSPVVNKVKDLLTSGAIGRILSTSVLSSAGNFGQTETASLGSQFNDASNGANMLSIHFGHLIDFVLYALSSDFQSLSATLSTQRPISQLKHPDGRVSDSKRETPDHILVQGVLETGSLISVHQRGGPPFQNTPGLQWRIYGETGEIQVSSQGSFLNVGYPDEEMKILLHEHASGEVKEVEWRVQDGLEGLPQAAQNVGRVYEEIARVMGGGKEEKGYADWEEAVKRHRLLEMLEESSRTGERLSRL